MNRIQLHRFRLVTPSVVLLVALVAGCKRVIAPQAPPPPTVTVSQPLQRNVIRCPSEGLKALGIDADRIEDVIITHMHYDHCGNHNLFERARYHVQDKEMFYVTGRCMCHQPLRHSFDIEDVTKMLRRLYEGRVAFHDGDDELAPGISVASVVQLIRSALVCSTRVRQGVLLMVSVTRPSDAREMPPKRGAGGDVERVNSIVARLKHIATVTGTTVIALSQLSRNVENRTGNDKSPKLSDLRYGGEAAAEAHVAAAAIVAGVEDVHLLPQNVGSRLDHVASACNRDVVRVMVSGGRE